MRGGKRPGAGRPPGTTTRKAARDVVKQVRWTVEEWVEVERLAEVAGMTASDYIRRATLDGSRSS
jgi:hypothetical protein